MANIRKTFNFRNGVQVDEDNFIVDSLGKVGVGTTVPNQMMDVRGNAKVVGIITSQSLETRNVNIAGVTTFSGTVHVGSAITMYPAAGIISARQVHGDGSNLINIPTSQWVDINAGLGFTSIYNSGFVGVSTNDPRFTLQIGGNNDLTTFANGVGINSSGNIVATGVITATNFKGDLQGNLTGNLTGSVNSTGLSTVGGLQLENSHLSSALSVGSTNLNVTGIATAASFVGPLTGAVTGNITGNVIGNLTGDVTAVSIGSTELTISGVSTFTGNIDANGDIDVDGHTELDNANVSGIITAVNVKVSTKLDLGSVSSQGINTSTPQSQLHVFNSGISSVLIESGSNESVITLGRNTNAQTSGAIKYGNKSGGFSYSNEDSLDIINYDSGNINYYLSGSNAGLGTHAKFHWLKGPNNTRLMTLTGIGSLGIGITTPSTNLHVIGSGTVSSNMTVGNNLTVNGSLIGNVTGNVTGTVTGHLNGTTANVSGVSTFTETEVTSGVGIGTTSATHPLNINSQIYSRVFVTDDGQVGVGTHVFSTNEVDVELVSDVRVHRSVSVGGTAISAVDFSDVVNVPGVNRDKMAYMIPPKITTTQRNALFNGHTQSGSPVAGALIYNTTTNKLQVYNGSAWQDCN